MERLNKSKLKEVVQRFSENSVLVIGDLMMDRFIWGRVERISPEAPVPVVEVEREEDRPGGAGNVVFNLASLEAQVFASGIVGMDSIGEKLARDFEYRGINVEGILLDPSRPTSLKSRVVATHQHIVRFDRETKLPIARDFEDRLLKVLESLIREASAVVLSDYGKGLITPRLIHWVIDHAKNLGKLIFVDPKPDHFRLYKDVTCVTPNTQEAFLGMGKLPKADDADIENIGREIVNELSLKELLITRGAKGMSLFRLNSERGVRPSVTHIPTRAQEVFDVTGAGDTVVASYALARASGAKPLEAAHIANLAAGVVVGKIGTATVTRTELLNALEELI